jgi:hypothetical protein
VTLYSRYRGYPYPRDAKEAGNGGLHSQLLAEAVERDLGVLDAGWAAEADRPTLMATKNGDQTGIGSGLSGATSLDNWTVEKLTGPTIFPSLTGTFRPNPGMGGWFHVSLTMRTKASGTVTADAVHRIGLRTFRVSAIGNYDTIETRWSQSFQTGSADMYNELNLVVYLTYTLPCRPYFQHTNTGSTATVVGSGTGGTRISFTRILGE